MHFSFQLLRDNGVKSGVADRITRMTEAEVISYLKALETIVTSDVAHMLATCAPATHCSDFDKNTEMKVKMKADLTSSRENDGCDKK